MSVVGYALVRRDVEVLAGGEAAVRIPLSEGTGGVLADDPLRAVEVLPGVATGDDLRSEFSVRGSDFSHMNLTVDGFPTPSLLHTVRAVEDSSASGSVAMINSDILDEVTLLSGGYAQRDGNRTGAEVSFRSHPGWPDREGFGRRTRPMTWRDVEALVCDQIAALARIAAAEGVRLRHVKAHGALYTAAARDGAIAAALAGAVRDADPSLVLFGAAGSEMLRAGAAAGLAVASEAFADRGYEADGSLTPRGIPCALIEDPGIVARRAVRMAAEGLVEASGGIEIAIRPATICVHGDTPGAVELAGAVRAALERAGLVLAPAAGGPHPLG